MQLSLRLTQFALTLAATITFVGCTESRPSNEFSRTKEQIGGNVSNRSSVENNVGTDYVTCRASFTTLNENYAWFENSDSGHDDGVASLASFQIEEPSSNIDRVIKILFKYVANDNVPGPPAKDDLGQQFTFDLPKHAFTDGITSVDNLTVRNLRKFKP